MAFTTTFSPIWVIRFLIFYIAVTGIHATSDEYVLRVDPVRSGLGVDWQGGTTLVSFANGTLWIGGIKYQPDSEPLIITGTAESGSNLFFTSYHSAPGDGQYVEVGPSFTGPLLTSGSDGDSLPEDLYTITGFKFDSDNRLNFNGNYNFIGCRNTPNQVQLETYQIWFKGGGLPPNGTVCTQMLYLYQVSGCQILG